MKTKYTLDIQEYSNKELTDCYRYDKLLTDMNAQVMEEFIYKLIYQIQHLYNRGFIDGNIFDFRQFGDDFFQIQTMESDVITSKRGTTYKHKEFHVLLNCGQQSRFKLKFMGSTATIGDSSIKHDYHISIEDLEDNYQDVSFKYIFGKEDDELIDKIEWYSKPHAQLDTPHFMRRFIRLVDGLEFLLTKEMDENTGEWTDIENNIYTPLSKLREKTTKYKIAETFFEIDKKMLRSHAIDKLVE